MSESNSTPTCKLAFWKQRGFFPPLPRPFFFSALFPLIPLLALAWEVGACLESLERKITHTHKKSPKQRGRGVYREFPFWRKSANYSGFLTNVERYPHPKTTPWAGGVVQFWRMGVKSPGELFPLL